MSWLKDNIMELLALMVVGGGGVLFYLADDTKATPIMAAITLVLGFYFGSSLGSRNKDKNSQEIR